MTTQDHDDHKDSSERQCQLRTALIDAPEDVIMRHQKTRQALTDQLEAIIESCCGPLAEATAIARELVETHKQNVDNFRRIAEKLWAITDEIEKANMNIRKPRKRGKKELVGLKVYVEYGPEDTDSGEVPDPKADDVLRKLIGRDFDFERKGLEMFGERSVGWVCNSEKEAARIIRIFVKHRLRYATSISNPEYQLQLSRFLKRHNISPEPYAPASLKDVINAGEKQ